MDPLGLTDLAIGNNDVINFAGCLAIVTNGRITMANRSDWNGSVGKNLYFIANYRSGLTAHRRLQRLDGQQLQLPTPR